MYTYTELGLITSDGSRGEETKKEMMGFKKQERREETGQAAGVPRCNWSHCSDQASALTLAMIQHKEMKKNKEGTLRLKKPLLTLTFHQVVITVLTVSILIPLREVRWLKHITITILQGTEH